MGSEKSTMIRSDKPITDYKQAVSYLKMLSKSHQKHFPHTAERLMEVVRVLRKHQNRT